jgi:tetratricopeptide (TPR) repeat protein
VTVPSGRLLVLGSVIASVCTLAAAALYATWPDNSVALYLHERRNRDANIRALEWRIAQEPEENARSFFRAWLAEERGDLDRAIDGFRTLRDAVSPDSSLHLRSALRLGQAYGLKGQPDHELAVYQGLMARYPGPSRLSQATYHLRRGDKDQARRLLEEALARDARDGSLGQDRQMALSLRAGLGPVPSVKSSGSP